MKRGKPGRSSKNSISPEPPDNVDDGSTDFDKDWNEPLLGPMALRIIIFSILTAILISMYYPGETKHYLVAVSKVFEHSFHLGMIKNIPDFLRSKFMALTNQAEHSKTKTEKKPKYVQPETFTDQKKQDVPKKKKVLSDPEEYLLRPDNYEDDFDNDKTGDMGSYKKIKITSEDDYKLRKVLDSTDSLLMKGMAEKALQVYEDILRTNPQSPRALLGKARCLFLMAEQRKSNMHLEQSIKLYDQIIRFTPNVPRKLMYKAGKKLAEMQNFRGWRKQAIKTIDLMLEKFPGDVELLKNVGVYCLEVGADERAKHYFSMILRSDPGNHYAKVHMGYILHHSDKNYEEAIKYYEQGMQGNDPVLHHGRFFLGYGDSLYKTDRLSEAHEVYKKGADMGAFPSQWQRSTYNCDVKKAQPWWTKRETGAEQFFTHLEDNWEIIRDEALSILNKDKDRFQLENEGLTDYGKWTELFLYSRGIKNEDNCKLVPKSCAMMSQFKEDSSCTRGQIKFSLINPNSHVHPHTGPSNCRLRAHLGLVVPQLGGTPLIRVGTPDSDYKPWIEGKFIIFDDSFEHEVWHNGTNTRMILIVDVWHPDVTRRDRNTLSPI